MSLQHLAIAKQNTGDNWITLGFDVAGRHWYIRSANASNLHAVVLAAVEQLRPGLAFSFSDRRAAQVMSDPFPDDPSGILQAAPEAMVTVMAPESKALEEDLWNALWRQPAQFGGDVSSAGRDGRFRVTRQEILAERIAGWFAQQHWRSWEPRHPREAFSPEGQQIERAPHPRDLWVRPAWHLIEAAPQAFR